MAGDHTESSLREIIVALDCSISVPAFSPASGGGRPEWGRPPRACEVGPDSSLGDRAVLGVARARREVSGDVGPGTATVLVAAVAADQTVVTALATKGIGTVPAVERI